MKRMKHPLRLVVSFPLFVALLIAGVPRSVRADGGAFRPTGYELDIEMPAQKAIVVWDEEKGHEDLILSVELLGGPEAAWVVPVPSLPEVRAASPEYYEQLSRLTQPKIETEHRRETCPIVDGQCIMTVYEEVEKEVGVEVISREEVGVYDVSVLSADDPRALLDWLNENGYAFPEEGGPILDAYVKEGGWYFVAARVLPDKSATLRGDVQPLWFSFDAERPIYPMRLTSLMEGSLHVLIYVLADHRMEITKHGFRTEFAGELKLREWAGEDEEVELLTHRPYYVTKLRRSVLYTQGMTQDLYLERATNDEPYREVIHRIIRTSCVCPTATAPPPTPVPTAASADQRPGGSGWLVLAGGLVLLGLLVGLGMGWRRSQGKSDNEQDV